MPPLFSIPVPRSPGPQPPTFNPFHSLPAHLTDQPNQPPSRPLIRRPSEKRLTREKPPTFPYRPEARVQAPCWKPWYVSTTPPIPWRLIIRAFDDVKATHNLKTNTHRVSQNMPNTQHIRC